LQTDGRLTNKLRQARKLQRSGCRIDIVSEDDLLARLGGQTPADRSHHLYTTAQLSRLLKVPGEQLRRWIAAGLVRSVETVRGVSHFDYSQVVSARTLCDLLRAGVKLERVRRSIRQLETWLCDVGEPLSQLAILERDGEVLVRLDDGLADATGQRCFDFSDELDEPTVTLARPQQGALEWFELGCEQEAEGRLSEATQAYRQALLLGGPNATVCFNLANVLNEMGKKDQAIERYYQAVECDRTFAEAWNNLGVVLSEMERSEEALAALERAIAVNPRYADARYNLADLIEECGKPADAQTHWQAYLQYDQQSEWARHARRRVHAIAK
jgi:tetratricopeptide (TPR) repeat protein